MSAPVLQEPVLTWGALSLVGPGESESAFDIEAIDGTNFGNPEPVIEVVRSLLIDGALAAVTGWDNRAVPIRLRISANDGEAAAEAEAALMQQVLLDRPPPLVFTPPLELSAPCVFDTVVARLDRDTDEGWDLDEVLRGDRFYLLTLTCLPFARAVESSTVEALPVPSDPGGVVEWVNVDTCDTATGWAAEGNTGDVQPAYDAGTWVETHSSISTPNNYLRLIRTGSIVVPAGRYLAIDVSMEASFAAVEGHWSVYYSGSWHSPTAIVPGIGEDGFTRLFFANVGTITSFKVAFDFTSVGAGAFVRLACSNVAYTDTIGSSTTTTLRQQSRLATVAGSMPTQAAARLYDATPADLGTDILLYTTRNTDLPPNLRAWLKVSESAAADSAMVSGSRHTLATATKFRVPAELLRTGSYALMARMSVSVAGTLGWSAKITALGGAARVGTSIVMSGEVDLEVTAGYEILNLAAMILPPVEIEETGIAVELTLTGTVDMILDEGWLFSLDDGALTWIKDTEGMDWIEVRSPELGAARPSVWGGRGALGTQAACIDWKCESFGSHRFEPGEMQIFTVTTTSLESQCELEFFPRFHSHVWGQETS